MYHKVTAEKKYGSWNRNDRLDMVFNVREKALGLIINDEQVNKIENIILEAMSDTVARF